ncbi:MAG: CCP domain-containing protein [Proteobacteria bacterium]|nr:CCP domain-containing protein [Pseudomonadota bacterium]
MFLAVHNIICGNPEAQIADSEVIISGYTTPAVEGTTVTFQCLPGLALVGSNLSTCMDTGEWEPAPYEISCSGDK